MLEFTEHQLSPRPLVSSALSQKCEVQGGGLMEAARVFTAIMINCLGGQAARSTSLVCGWFLR